MNLHWFGYLFLALGVVLWVMAPVLWTVLRRDPTALLRSQWQDLATPGCGWALGLLGILLALVGGTWSVYVGLRLLG